MEEGDYWDKEILPKFKPFETLQVSTAKNGWHYYFKLDKRLENMKNGIGIFRKNPSDPESVVAIDVRCNGGYIVAPNSIVGLRKNDDGAIITCNPHLKGAVAVSYKIASLTEEPIIMPDDIYDWLMSENCAHSSMHCEPRKKKKQWGLSGMEGESGFLEDSNTEEVENDETILEKLQVEQMKEILEHIAAPVKGSNNSWEKYQNITNALKTYDYPLSLHSILD